MVSLFLTRHDQYLIMFKHSNVFEVTNLLFQTKYNNAVALFANSKLFIVEEGKRKIIEPIFRLNLLCIYL